MCDPLTIIAGIGLVAGVAGSISSGNQQRQYAQDTAAYNAEVTRIQGQYRRDVMEYQNTDYAQNVDFYKKQIAWEKGEFEKTKLHVTETKRAIEDNFFGKLATQVQQAVEADIARTLGVVDTNTQVRNETGKLEAMLADTGTGGNSSNMLRGDLQRQGGNARQVFDMNNEATRRQIVLEMRGTKAQRDGAMGQITVPTFQPIAPPKAPGPVNPINPSAPVSMPSSASIGLNAISSGINLGMGARNFAGMF